MTFLKRTHFRKPMKVKSFGHFQIKIYGKVLLFWFFWAVATDIAKVRSIVGGFYYIAT